MDGVWGEGARSQEGQRNKSVMLPWTNSEIIWLPTPPTFNVCEAGTPCFPTLKLQFGASEFTTPMTVSATIVLSIYSKGREEGPSLGVDLSGGGGRGSVGEG